MQHRASADFMIHEKAMETFLKNFDPETVKDEDMEAIKNNQIISFGLFY
jgi:hypothetical protein